MKLVVMGGEDLDTLQQVGACSLPRLSACFSSRLRCQESSVY
jgi:hypothetical protein